MPPLHHRQSFGATVSSQGLSRGIIHSASPTLGFLQILSQVFDQPYYASAALRVK